MKHKKKFQLFNPIKLLKHQELWVSSGVGAIIAGALWGLLFYKSSSLTGNTLNLVSAMPFIGFVVVGIYFSYRALFRSERRSKMLSAQWIMQGARNDDIQYKALLNAISDVIFELDSKGRVVYLNQNFAKLTNIVPEDWFDKPFFDMLHPSQQRENIKRYSQFMQKKLKPYRVLLNIEVYDGSYRTVEMGFRIITQDDDGDKHAIGTIVDKHDQKQDKVAAAEAEQKYRDIYENAVNGIYQTTMDGKFISVNPAFARILGYDSPQDVVNSVHSISAQVYIRPEDRTRFKSEMDEKGFVEGIETQVYRKDGTKVWIVENARAVKERDDRTLYYEGTIWDVTERRKTEEDLKYAKLNAEMNSRTKTEFLANMSHELRTPLNAIIGFSEILKDEIMGPIGNDDYKEYALDIYNSGHSLLKIISEILEVSKIEAGNRDLNEGPVKMERAAKACLVILNGKIEDHELSVKLDMQEDLPELIGEELVIKQIILNLVSNSVKFTPVKGHIFIRAYIDEKSENFVLEVADTGIGMSDEELAKAMQPFWQANSSLARDISGTGLGLSLVQSLAGLHGAKLELESEVDKGTTARVIFPKKRIISRTEKPVTA